MSTCKATVNLRTGLMLRCDRTAGHEHLENDGFARWWHYDFHQDAEWTAARGPDHSAVDVVFRTVGQGWA